MKFGWHMLRTRIGDLKCLAPFPLQPKIPVNVDVSFANPFFHLLLILAALHYDLTPLPRKEPCVLVCLREKSALLVPYRSDIPSPQMSRMLLT